MANDTNEMEMADQDSHCTHRRSMTWHSRRLGSGCKGDPHDRTVINAVMSLQNKCVCLAGVVCVGAYDCVATFSPVFFIAIVRPFHYNIHIILLLSCLFSIFSDLAVSTVAVAIISAVATSTKLST
eukprot:12089098-Ditylum_brightwellii.AAC.1